MWLRPVALEADWMGPASCVHQRPEATLSAACDADAASTNAGNRSATMGTRMAMLALCCLTFDMSGGPKGAKRPLVRPLDGGVGPHAGNRPTDLPPASPCVWRFAPTFVGRVLHYRGRRTRSWASLRGRACDASRFGA